MAMVSLVFHVEQGYFRCLLDKEGFKVIVRKKIPINEKNQNHDKTRSLKSIPEVVFLDCPTFMTIFCSHKCTNHESVRQVSTGKRGSILNRK